MVEYLQKINFRMVKGFFRRIKKKPLWPKLKAVKGDLQSVHDKFVLENNDNTVAVDLGCGSSPRNLFNASEVIGIDLKQNEKNNVLIGRLGFEKLPFADDSIDYLTAYDVLEHIPRYADLPDHNNTPFIFLMNECYRVLKTGGVFLSMTPIYPYLAAFQDPTHNNIMTADTFKVYFSNQKANIACHYGITAHFKILYQRMLKEHMIAVLEK